MENNLKSLILPVFYCVLVTIISIWDFDSSNLPTQYISDKLAHSVIYFIFVLIWYKPLYMVYNKSLLFIVLLSFLFGLILELIQSNLSYRSFEIYDLIFNLIGSLLGYFILLITTKRH